MKNDKISIALGVRYEIADRYGCVMESEDYYSAIRADDPAKIEELERKVCMANAAQNRAQAFIDSLKALDPHVPASDIACLMKAVHRATQAEIVDTAIKLLSAFALFGENDLDARNADAVATAVKMLEGAFVVTPSNGSVSLGWKA